MRIASRADGLEKSQDSQQRSTENSEFDSKEQVQGVTVCTARTTAYMGIWEFQRRLHEPQGKTSLILSLFCKNTIFLGGLEIFFFLFC